MLRDLLFASLALPIDDRETLLRQIVGVSGSAWLHDEFRESYLLPLRNRSGGLTWSAMADNSPATSPFTWTSHASPELRAYFEKHIFPWSGGICRITVLRTPAGKSNREHIDCSPQALGSPQHKFRWVLQGVSENLYFVTQDGRVAAPRTELPFLMDGSWPHGMQNSSRQDKITLCMGAPWTVSENYPPLSQFVSSSALQRPLNQEVFFEAKYREASS